jgi:uncharacterized protein YdhG (YjbR/CyaY superfamily)
MPRQLVKAKSRTETKTRSTSRMKSGYKTIDEYLDQVPDAEKRAALETLRKTIRAAAPRAEECISYQIPAFRLNGLLVAFAAAAKHCSFFPASGRLIAAHKRDLKGYDTSKGTIRFQPNRPLPAALVRRLVKARIAENTR